jgi:hypothetical protein
VCVLWRAAVGQGEGGPAPPRGEHNKARLRRSRTVTHRSTARSAASPPMGEKGGLLWAGHVWSPLAARLGLAATGRGRKDDAGDRWPVLKQGHGKEEVASGR